LVSASGVAAPSGSALELALARRRAARRRRTASSCAGSARCEAQAIAKLPLVEVLARTRKGQRWIGLTDRRAGTRRGTGLPADSTISPSPHDHRMATRLPRLDDGSAADDDHDRLAH
jgi:hypothetical protein